MAPAQSSILRTLRSTGPNANRINVVLLGDGFRAAEQDAFFAAAQQKLGVLVANEAFAPFADVINAYAIFTASNESGTDVPSKSVTRDTYYDTGYVSTVNDRLLVIGTSAGSARAFTELRAQVPDYDVALMIVNTPTYGGAGGVPTVVSLDASSDEVMLHELGHAFALLTDEYVDEQSAPSYPPAERINATQKTARADIPWRDFIQETTPVPTIVPASDTNLVGLWEGSHYRSTGFYRPVYDSKMRSLNRAFGPVNLRAFGDAVHRLNLNLATARPSLAGLRAPTARAGSGGGLTLEADGLAGTGPLTYQWSRNGKYLPGQTRSTLALVAAGLEVIGSYALEVTNAMGTIGSAELGVTAAVVATGSGSATAYEVQIGSQSVARWAKTGVLVAESARAVVLTVSRGGSTGSTFSVAYASSAGTASSALDFTAQSGTLEWAAGDTSDRTITIAVAADTVVEGIETFTVTLSSPRGGIIAGSSSVTVSVADPGLRDPAFTADFINSSVSRILPLSDGSLLIAGSFSSAQTSAGVNQSVGRIIRLGSGGQLDPTFRPGLGANGAIQALARQPDGKILIGGDFTSYNGVSRGRIARLNADGSLDPSFDPGVGADRTVYDLVVLPDGRIMVAGAFLNVGGTAREYLARLRSDGTIDATFSGPDFAGASGGWWVRSLALQPDGKILVGGVFYFAGTSLRASVVRLLADGGVDSSFAGVAQGANAAFNPVYLGEVRQLALQADGRILLAGDFSSYNQTARRGVARLTSTGALDATFDPGTGADQAVNALLLQADGRIIIGGAFTAFNGTPVNRLARLNADGSLEASFAAAGGPNGAVYTLSAASDGMLYLGSAVAALQASTVPRPVWRLSVGPELSAVAPAISSSLIASGLIRTPFEYMIAATNVPTTYAAAGLPAGLTVDAATGRISGVPTVTGTFPILLSASNAGGSDSRTLLLSIVAPDDSARLINLSLLTEVAGAGDAFTVGAVVGGIGTTGTKPVLVRAVGPSLAPLGVTGVLADPRMEFYAGGMKVAENDDWAGAPALLTAFAAVGAFSYASPGSKDSALHLPSIAPGDYSIRVSGSSATGGRVMAELYDATPSTAVVATTPRLINVSALKPIGNGFTVGFVVAGRGSRPVLVRAVGPGLAGVGVAAGFLADPQLALFAAEARVDGNDDWGGAAALQAAFLQAGAFGLPAASRDAALLATLPAGSYSVQVSGPVGGVGLVLVEVYALP